MHGGRRYGLTEYLLWTRRDIYLVLVLATVPVAAYEFLHWTWLAIPWVPVALVGTAAAFIVGFRNNATFDRVWEGRQIWGSIVNSSRTWGRLVTSFVPDPESQRRLVHRHLAWLTALRFQLREPRSWENMDHWYLRAYQRKYFAVAEWDGDLLSELGDYLSPAECEYVAGKTNRATHLITLQIDDPACSPVG